jgi:hypothetical protein
VFFTVHCCPKNKNKKTSNPQLKRRNRSVIFPFFFREDSCWLWFSKRKTDYQSFSSRFSDAFAFIMYGPGGGGGFAGGGGAPRPFQVRVGLFHQ